MTANNSLLSGLSEVQVGARQTTKITAIKEGTKADFYGDEYWAAIKEDKASIEAQKKQPALEVATENGATVVIAIPANKVVNPKSNLALWKKTYGKYPEVGQQINTKTDENGFQKVVIEK
jgi:hypothetical protein